MAVGYGLHFVAVAAKMLGQGGSRIREWVCKRHRQDVESWEEMLAKVSGEMLGVWDIDIAVLLVGILTSQWVGWHVIWRCFEMLLDSYQLRPRHLEPGVLGGRRMKNWDMSWNKFHQIQLISNVFCLLFAGSRRGWGYRTIGGTTAVQQHNIHILPWTGGPCKTSDCWQANGQEVSNPKFWACGFSWFKDPRGSKHGFLEQFLVCRWIRKKARLGLLCLDGAASQHVRNMWKHHETSQDNREMSAMLFSETALWCIVNSVSAAILHWLSDSTDRRLIQDLFAITFSLSAFSLICQFAFLKTGLNKYNIIFFNLIDTYYL